jgi:indolepyruvate ferredoxin oxidoreductase, alpha subunit
MNTSTFLTGSQAAARGAFEANISFAAGFHGEPVTDLLNILRDDHGLDVQFAPNEKVALEVAYGASRGGVRSAVVLRQAGINIAAEPLVSATYSGVNAGLVIISIDDPGMLTSSNEQDTRHVARSAKLPLLAPSDQQEALDFIKLAADISEKYTLPVMVRLTSRLCYSGSVLQLHDADEVAHKQLVTTSANLFPARRHEEIEKHLSALEAFANKAFDINSIDVGSPDVGIITSGISYAYAKEVLPDASYLKLGIIHPLPHKLISYFAGLVKRLYVIEELDPFLEEQIRAMGIEVIGKSIFPRSGELNPDIVAKGLAQEGVDIPEATATGLDLPQRHSNLCQTCVHHGLRKVFDELKLNIVGDIGCYSPGEHPPSDNPAHDTCFSIGASMSVSFGMNIAGNSELEHKTIAVLSGSTFMHSGMQALANVVLNNGTATVCILTSPGHGRDAGIPVDFKKICEGLGISSIHTVSSSDEEGIARILKEEMPKKGVSVLITDANPV